MCSNCGACEYVCPKNAISFRSSSMGRIYATVSADCVNCGLCNKVCPSVDELQLHKRYDKPLVGEIKGVYVGRSTDDKLFSNSQSGGAASAIISFLLDNKIIDAALVCVICEGGNPHGEAQIITRSSEIAKSQKSCYTPVTLLTALKEAKEFNRIAIVGLPCQIEAVTLLCEQKKLTNIIYKIGLICDRMLCDTITDVMMSISHFKSGKIDWRRKAFTYKNRFYPYKTAPVVVHNIKETRVIPNSYRFSLKEMFTPLRCRVCYDKLNTHSDITLGDPWGMSNVDWERGASLVITRNEKGNQLICDIEEARILDISPRTIQEVLQGQQIDKRLEQINMCSSIIGSIANPSASFLLSSEKSFNKDIVFEFLNKEIHNFVELEGLSKSDIIKIAKKKVRHDIFMSKLASIKSVIKKIVR